MNTSRGIPWTPNKRTVSTFQALLITDKQEKDIRDIVSEAAYMQKIDEKLSKELKKMSSEIQELKKENSKYNKKIESKIKDTNLNAEKSKNYYNGKITDQENSVNKLITEAKSFSKSIKSVKDSLVKNSDGLRDEFSGKFDGIIESLSIKMVWKAIQILNKKDKIRFKLLLCGVVLSGMEEVINEMQREDCDSLQLIAPVTPDKVAVLYKDVDIAFILPEGSNVKFKGYGVHVKLYESLATGTPAIINKFGENAKLLENTDCVIVLDEMKMDNLVEGIELLAADAKKRVQMGKLGKEFIKSKFNWNKNRSI